MFVFLFSFVTKQYTEVRRYFLVSGFRFHKLAQYIKTSYSRQIMVEKTAKKLEPIKLSTSRALIFIAANIGGAIATQEAGGYWTEVAAGVIGGAVVATAFEGKETSRGKVVACMYAGALAATAAVGLYHGYKTGDMMSILPPAPDITAAVLGGYEATVATNGGMEKPQHQA
jgi:ABC-type uncharacterized transport system permease subunit